MQVKEILLQATARLKEQGIETARLDAEVLLAYLLDKERYWLYMYPEKEVSEEIIKRYNSLIDRRELYEPVAYLTGKKEFMGLDFCVSRDVLIPRPDTEVIVEMAVRIIKETPYFLEKYRNGTLQVLDLCCGSGNIGIALAKEMPGLKVVFSDISEKALEMTKTNCQIHEIEPQLVKSDLFSNINSSFDLIVSNPPYIKNSDLSTLSREIKDWEPHLALNGGKKGYDYYDRIIKESAVYLNDKGCLILEAGDGQAEGLTDRLREEGYQSISTLKDLSGIQRAVLGFQSV